ncbi:MAG: hypothetical protein ACOYYU_16160 [Chloroflexota bacterium]
MAAGQFVERRVQFARLEGFADFDLLPAVPPVGAGGIEYVLSVWFRLTLLRAFFGLILEF